jgi:cell division protein FtsB
MGLLQQLVWDLRAGVANLRYGTADVARRALEESERLRIRLQVDKLNRRIDDLQREIGERALELYERQEPLRHISGDHAIAKLVEQVEALRAERMVLEQETEELRARD